MKNKILNFNVSTVNNESYIRNEAVNQPIYFRTQQLSDKVKECERLILKFYNCESGRVIFLSGTGTLGRKSLIDNLLKSTNDIYSIDTLSNRSIKISSDLELSKNLKEYLESTDSSKISFLDTYPFTNLSWVSGNTSNGNTVGSVEQFNDTTKTFIYLDEKKTIARINETEKYTNLSLLSDFRTLNNGAQPYLATTNAPINSQLALKNFYSGREIKDFYITESYVNYGNSYSGNVGTQIQTTSLLNTPYFINALVKGVDENKTNTDNAFTTLGYLFLNSLPLITTKEKIKSIENDVATDLDYLASTLKKYSAVHQVPYAWVLKYGSIWYRYKKYVNENVDILDSVWKNFDYVGSYDPVTSGLTTQYTIPDYSGNSQTMVLQKTENGSFVSSSSINSSTFLLSGKLKAAPLISILLKFGSMPLDRDISSPAAVKNLTLVYAF